MGKSNRIRADRSTKQISNPVKYKKKKGLPLWAKTLIAAVVTIAVLATCAVGILSTNGVFMRYNSAVSSENYRISGNMMAYFYQTQYQNFYSSYSDYMSYFSLDTSKSLKEQQFGDTTTGYGYETQFLGEFDGTWFDYFMNAATEQAKQILIYCEEADARGISLNDEDMAEIQTALDTIESTATTYGYSTNSYVSTMYGTGVKISDVKKAMELSYLAEKCMIDIQDEIEAGITEGDIISTYTDNKLDFNVIDYTYYTFSVTYDDVAAEVLGSDYTEAELKASANEVLTKYAEKIKDIKATVSEFEKAESTEEFQKQLYEYLATKYYEENYADNGLEADKLPAEEVVNSVKASVIEAVVSDVVAGKTATETAYTEADGTYTLYSNTVTEEFAVAIDEIKTSVFNSILTDKETYIVEKAAYSEGDDFSEWAFEDGRAANDTKSILTGDGAESDEILDDEGSFNASVYILSSAQYRDEELSKNVSYLVFSTEDAAKSAIEAFAAGTISKEAFEAVGTELSATANSEIEDYTEGSLGVDAFDEWLFDSATKVGSYTTSPISSDDTTYIVAYYNGDGEANWRISVKSSIFNDRYSDYYSDMETKYTVTVKDRILNKIGE